MQPHQALASFATFQKAASHFGDAGVAQLIFAVVVTNSWNRLAIATHRVAEVE